MKIHCIIPGVQGADVQVGDSSYTFALNQHGHSVADVPHPRHCDLLLARSDAYVVYRDPDDGVLAPPDPVDPDSIKPLLDPSLAALQPTGLGVAFLPGGTPLTGIAAALFGVNGEFLPAASEPALNDAARGTDAEAMTIEGVDIGSIGDILGKPQDPVDDLPEPVDETAKTDGEKSDPVDETAAPEAPKAPKVKRGRPAIVVPPKEASE